MSTSGFIILLMSVMTSANWPSKQWLFRV